VGPNPSEKLPRRDSYTADTQVGELVSLPYSEYAKLILKVSHNLGANLSLMLFGVAKGVNTIKDALKIERNTLIEQWEIKGNEFDFPTNGSGSPDSRATPDATIKLLKAMSEKAPFIPYFDSLPKLGVDGSLAAIGVNSPARGKVDAKTGTFISGDSLRAQVLAGYIAAQSGKRLILALYVNDAGRINGISDVIDVFKDEGQIATILFESN
jgi:D-alanyl-D-alanine carboxypeptidase/D-alanyl-D-alanine-endopeptidase (penicillin-binding protein 4)